MSLYSGNPASNPGSITLPDDGDETDAASVTDALKALADKTAHILEGDTQFTGDKKFEAIEMLGAASVDLVSRAIAKMLKTPSKYPAADWSEHNDGYYQTTTAGATSQDWPLDVPDGCVVTGITAYIDPAAGHGGVNPTLMPKVEFMKQEIAPFSAASVIATATDATAAASYEAAHNFSKLDCNETISNRTHRYWFRFHNESGGSAQFGLKLHGMKVTFNVTRIDESGA